MNTSETFLWKPLTINLYIGVRNLEVLIFRLGICNQMSTYFKRNIVMSVQRSVHIRFGTHRILITCCSNWTQFTYTLNKGCTLRSKGISCILLQGLPTYISPTLPDLNYININWLNVHLWSIFVQWEKLRWRYKRWVTWIYSFIQQTIFLIGSTEFYQHNLIQSYNLESNLCQYNRLGIVLPS